MRMFNLLSWIVMAMLLTMATAQGSMTPKVGLRQAAEVAENALRAFNAGDYASWSRDWSEAMTTAIKERDFMAFREQTIRSHGQYQSMTKAELTHARTPGHIRWEFTCIFERGQLKFILTFKEDGEEVEGALVEPVN